MKSVRLTLIVIVKALTATTVIMMTAAAILMRMQHLHYIQQWVIVIKLLMNSAQQYLRFLQKSY